jgi:glucose/arabinose dehydrogenase
VKERIGPGEGGSGVTWHAGWLYFASDHGVWRYRWPSDAARPDLDGVEIVVDLPDLEYGYAHNAKGIAVGSDGRLYISIGSASDNCGNDNQGVPGTFPCPQLDARAGIWAFAPLTEGRGSARGTRIATGLRNAMPLAVDSLSGELWALSHGRDGLNQRWGWSNARSADQPAEILARITPDADFGWPYCMPVFAEGAPPSYERAPEYASVVGAEADCATKTPFVHGFPGHWAPMSVAPSPTGGDSMVVSFHGSRGRRPLREEGFHALIGSRDQMGEAVVLLRARPGMTPTRLVGTAWEPTGEIYLSDDAAGRVWLVRPGDPRPRR